jgi:hypothetical protein
MLVVAVHGYRLNEWVQALLMFELAGCLEPPKAAGVRLNIQLMGSPCNVQIAVQQ